MPAKRVRRLALERGSDVTVTLHPTREWLGEQRSQLPAVVLGAGLALSVLLMLALRSAQTSAARSLELEGEVRAHERAEAEIRRLNFELEDRVADRTAELRRTNEELKSFAGFLSHELRQPISAQSLWTDLLESEYAASLDEQAREYLAQIRRYNRRTSDLIGAQLVLAEIGTAPIAIGRVDVDGVFEELRRDFKPELDAAHAALRKSELPEVEADPRHVYQLFRNLIENSIKYRRADVPLEIRAFGRRTEDAVEIQFRDNGRGFAAGDEEKIFEIFERAGETGAEGVGLGLAVCRRIVERCGGEIEASSAPEGGAVFDIRFPRPEGDDDAPAERLSADT